MARLRDSWRLSLSTAAIPGNPRDSFSRKPYDTVLTFALGADKIDLSTVFAATGSVVNAGNLAEFVQTSSAAGGTDTFLSVDANGFVGGSSFVTIALVDNVTSAQLFDANDFVL